MTLGAQKVVLKYFQAHFQSEQEPRGASRSQKPRGARKSQEEPRGARRSQEEPGRRARSQEEPGGARRDQEEVGGARKSQKGPDNDGDVQDCNEVVSKFIYHSNKHLPKVNQGLNHSARVRASRDSISFSYMHAGKIIEPHLLSWMTSVQLHRPHDFLCIRATSGEAKLHLQRKTGFIQPPSIKDGPVCCEPCSAGRRAATRTP
jgi:hypothetical protein